MPKVQQQLNEVSHYLSLWITEIATNNSQTYFDINKISEGTSVYLLNLLYGWKLIDLNDEQQNFPGIDIGDKESSCLAFQITSRTDVRKIRKTLQIFLERDYLKIFPSGVRFLLLSNQKRPIIRNDDVKDLYGHFFDPKKHILLVRDLMLQAKIIYYEDQSRFEILKLFLQQEFGQQMQRKNRLITFENNNQKIKFFKQLFIANQNGYTQNFIPVEYILNKQSYFSDVLVDQHWANDGLIIYGPSGCGKSALARQIAVKKIGNIFPVFLQAKYYDSSLQDLFIKELDAYGFDSDVEFLTDAKCHEQHVLLIIDGLNECKHELRSKLAIEMIKIVADKKFRLIVTTQTQQPELQGTGFSEIYIQRPSKDICEAIVYAYSRSTAAKKLTSVLSVVSTVLEAKMIGEIGADELTTNNRFVLFWSFIKIKLNESYIGGFLLMALIAKSMSERVTFSLCLRVIEDILLKHNLAQTLYAHCLKSGILDERSSKISFSHEMFFNFFVAESIARFAVNSNEILSALKAPKNADKKLLIIGAIDDEQLLNEVLMGINDPNLFAMLLDGEAGEYCKLWVTNQLLGLLPRIEEEISNCEFEFAETPHHFQFVESKLKDWSELDLALLFSIHGKLLDGEFLAQVLEIIHKMDAICATAVKNFWDEAKSRNISARSNIFLATYNGVWQRKMALSLLFSSLHSGFLGFQERNKIPVEELYKMIRGKQLTPGQIYFLLLLFRWNDRLQLLFPFALSILRHWRQAPYHLLSEILQQVGHIYNNGEERDELINTIKTMHSETQNIWLSTEIFDALGALGELEDDANEYIHVVNKEIDVVLMNPHDKNSFEAAAGIFFRQFDHPYDSAYYNAIDQLQSERKRNFLEMALQGGHSAMFTVSLIFRAVEILDKSAMKHLIKWTETPFIEPTFPVDSLAVFFMVHLVLGQNNYPISIQELNSNDKRENSIRALAELYYWMSRSDVNETQKNETTIQLAKELFILENNYIIETIWQSRHALYQQSHFRKIKLNLLQEFVVDYKKEIVISCRKALLNHDWQKDIWGIGRRNEEVIQHTILLLSETGSIIDLDVLRPLVNDPIYGRYAVDAIKSLGG